MIRIANQYGGFTGSTEDVLKLFVVIVAQLCEYINNQ
jgi:hypothetical protein